MRPRHYYLVLAFAIGVLMVGASGKMELPEPDESLLLAQPNPVLKDIDALYFDLVIGPAEPEPNEVDQVWKKLEAQAAGMLNKAGIKIVPDIDDGRGRSGAPELKVYVDLLKLKDLQQYVFRIQTLLARKVYVKKDSSWAVKAYVWSTKPAMQAVSKQKMPDKAGEVVLGQVQSFINCYLISNAKTTGPVDPNKVSTAPKEQATASTEPAPVKYRYVGSKKSEVFHKSDCRWVGRIKPENLVGYNRIDEATKAGKRPCKRCKPSIGTERNDNGSRK